MLHLTPIIEPVAVELPVVGEIDECAEGAVSGRTVLHGLGLRRYAQNPPDLLRARVTPAPL